MGTAVGLLLGADVGTAVLGRAVGLLLGTAVGTSVEGDMVGWTIGLLLGARLKLGLELGAAVGALLSAAYATSQSHVPVDAVCPTIKTAEISGLTCFASLEKQ